MRGMGFMADVKKINEGKEQNAVRALEAQSACGGGHYVTEVNKGSLNVGRWQALEMCRRAGRGRVHVFDVENHDGTPVYVHAKVCVVDDVWAGVGSANLNRRSWSHDSELSCAVLDDTPAEREPRDPAGLDDLDHGVAVARRAMLGPADVLNTADLAGVAATLERLRHR